ncbi:MAG: response regulator [Flavobacteriales bacterium]
MADVKVKSVKLRTPLVGVVKKMVSFELSFECTNQETLNATSKSSNTDVLQGKRILVAEDVELNQLVTRLMLESFGCKVVIAANGKKALEIYRPEQFDLIIMDIEMPIMNGIEATKSLREKFGPDIKIIGLSADALGNDSDYYVENGFTDYLTKPVKKEFLAQKLRDCLPVMTGTVV